MHNGSKRFLRAALFTGLFFCVEASTRSAAYGQVFSGTYTIGGAGATYAKFSDAFLAINAGYISGPTTFKVRPGVYNEQAALLSVKGTASNRLLTFESESGNNNDVLLTYTAPGGTTDVNAYTLRIAASSWVVFRNIGIEAKGTTAGSAILFNLEAQDIRITGCRIYADSTFSGSSPNTQGLRTYNAAGFGTVGNMFNSSRLLIDNCIFVGGEYGIRLQGNNLGNTARDMGHIIRNNVFRNNRVYGISTQHCDMREVSGNKVYMGNFTSDMYGISIESSDSNLTINGNYINGANNVGLRLSSVKAPNQIMVSNNMIIGSFTKLYRAGLYLGSNAKIGVYHNTVVCTGNEAESKPFYYAGSVGTLDTANVRVKNNLWANLAGGYAYYIASSSSSGIVESDYNVLYTNGSCIGRVGDNRYCTIESFRTVTGKDANSKIIDPDFRNLPDLHVEHPALDGKGAPLPLVTKDFDGETRNATNPDPGADEFSVTGIDLNLTYGGPASFGLGNNTIYAVMRNGGIYSLKDSIVGMRYSINGGTSWSATENYTIKNLIAYGDQEIFFFQTPAQISSAGNYNLCVQIEPAKRLISDLKSGNESYCTPVCVGLKGEFTIGGTGADFASLSAAIDTLKKCGAAGKVTLKFRSGTYSMVQSIPEILGLNDTTRLNLTSETGVATDVILSRTPGSVPGNQGVIKLDGAKYVTIRNLSIHNMTGDFNSFGLYITNNASHNIIENCVIHVDSAKQGSEQIYAIVQSAPGESNPVSYTKGDYNVIRGNRISGGISNIRLYGRGQSSYGKGSIIEDNILRAAYSEGIYCIAQENTLISGNGIIMRTTNTSSYGINFSNGERIRIEGNYVRNGGFTGIYVASVEGVDTNLIINNMIAGGFRNSSARGLLINWSSRFLIAHNSIRMDQTGTGTSCLAINGNGKMSLLNNVMGNFGGGYAYMLGSLGLKDTCNFNLLYTTGTNLAQVASTNYTTLTNLQAIGIDQHSVSFDPQFVAPADLHVQHSLLKGIGPKLARVPLDFDKEPRGASPHIGADEFMSYDLGIKELGPTVAKQGNNTVYMVLENKGLASLKNRFIKMQFTGDQGATWSAEEIYQIKGLETFGSTEHYEFTNPWVITGTGPRELKAKLILNTGLPEDVNDKNDTLNVAVCVGSDGGTFVVGAAPSDFPSINAALNAVLNQGCGLGGPVELLLKNGVFNEQVRIGKVVGVSPINTITIRSQSGSRENVQIMNPGGGTAVNKHVLNLDGAEHVIIKDISIRNTHADTGVALLLTGGARNILIENCVISTDSIQTGTALNPVMAEMKDKAIEDIRILWCRIQGGFYGVYTISSGMGRASQWVLRDNHVLGAYSSGVFMTYVRDAELNTNTLRPRAGNDFSYGAYLSQWSGYSKILNNTLHSAGSVGLYLEQCQGALVANNMIGGNFSNASQVFALQIVGSDSLQVYHNSLLADKKTTFTVAGYFSGTNTRIKSLNNSFANTGEGYALYCELGASMQEQDYNNYYTNGSKLAWYEGEMSNLVSLRTASGKDAKSISAHPEYLNATNLHSFSSALNKAGKFLPTVPRDIDNELRHTSTPDIGADEFEPGPDIQLQSIVDPKASPVKYFKDSSYTVKVVVRNAGNNMQSAIPVYYREGNKTPVEESLAGPLAVSTQQEYTFTTKWIPTAAGTFRFCAYTGLPGDINAGNDTVCRNVLVDLKSGVDGAPNTSLVTVYPNPATDQVWISGTDAPLGTMHLLGLDGRIAREFTWTRDEPIHLKEIPAGLYHYRILFNQKAAANGLLRLLPRD